MALADTHCSFSIPPSLTVTISGVTTGTCEEYGATCAAFLSLLAASFSASSGSVRAGAPKALSRVLYSLLPHPFWETAPRTPGRIPSLSPLPISTPSLLPHMGTSLSTYASLLEDRIPQRADSQNIPGSFKATPSPGLGMSGPPILFPSHKATPVAAAASTLPRAVQ